MIDTMRIEDMTRTVGRNIENMLKVVAIVQIIEMIDTNRREYYSRSDNFSDKYPTQKSSSSSFRLNKVTFENKHCDDKGNEISKSNDAMDLHNKHFYKDRDPAVGSTSLVEKIKEYDEYAKLAKKYYGSSL